MRIDLFIRRIVILTSLVLISWLPAPAAQAADQPSGGSLPVVSTGEATRLAAGGVEDTLKACLARIPKNGSAGQLMLAEQSCKQDERNRQVDRDGPKF
jgi:hypothetical protein